MSALIDFPRRQFKTRTSIWHAETHMPLRAATMRCLIETFPRLRFYARWPAGHRAQCQNSSAQCLYGWWAWHPGKYALGAPGKHFRPAWSFVRPLCFFRAAESHAARGRATSPSPTLPSANYLYPNIFTPLRAMAHNDPMQPNQTVASGAPFSERPYSGSS